MFEKHPEYEEPNEDAVLWRYQDIPRYLDLLIKQQLFFSRADKFEDPYEGKLVESESAAAANNSREPGHGATTPKTLQHNAAIELIAEHEVGCINRTLMTISSWHHNMEENYAMWNIYAKGTYGVAIQTTYNRLKASFNNTDRIVHIGKVKYYNDHESPNGQIGSHTPFLRKRAIYRYENEVRCCHVVNEQQAEEFCWEQDGNYNGVSIDVDLDVLIERIYISPYSPAWIHQIIKGTNAKFNLNKEIVHSSVFDASSY